MFNQQNASLVAFKIFTCLYKHYTSPRSLYAIVNKYHPQKYKLTEADYERSTKFTDKNDAIRMTPTP